MITNVSPRISYRPKRHSAGATIRVLCAQRDVIGKIGGGEAASSRMLERVTDAFVTWPVSQGAETALPPNFDCVSIDMPFRSIMKDRVRLLPPDLEAMDCLDFCEALSIAHAVKGQEFDIVECPDYLTYGRFLPFAFAEYRVKYHRLVCSLHGRSSRTFEIENQFNEVIPLSHLHQLRQAEQQFAFGTADVRYGFSDRYIAQTKAIQPLPIALVDPLCALPGIQPSALDARARGQVWFIARQDRVKGADLFLAAMFRAGEAMWNNYVMCGPSVRFRNHVSIFEAMSYCRRRGMPFCYRGPLPYLQLVRQAYQNGALVVVASREETFSLVALEALLNGAPILISTHAGAADFIRRRFGADFAGAIEFDPFDEFGSAHAIRSMWKNWEYHRAEVARALVEIDLTPEPDRLLEAYASAPGYDSKLRDAAFEEWNRVLKAYSDLKSSVVLSNPKEKPSLAPVPAVTGSALFKLADMILEAKPTDNPFRSFDEAHRLAQLSPYLNRARIYRYLAQCEQASRPTVAAAYRLRAFRMNGLASHEVADLVQELGRHSFLEEQTCLRLWSNGKAAPGMTAYLEERQKMFLQSKLEASEYTIDRRHERQPKVSVIVSMYDAAKPVLEHFLAHLSSVAMLRQHQAEVVFVDSGSPSHQMGLLRSIPSLQGLSYVLARSVHRETIQTAWNRGIQLSRGEYITCLGVDEGLTETALDDLARFLDEHPEVDWVTANTVVTQVDMQGRWKRDVMSYERFPYSRFNYLNDCTYINYVGGLHRRSIYSRFGWYDGSFKGAGDTEFKCRIFPFIRTAALPKTLGFYFDFPAARATNSANTEVEDLRAWYFFRTLGGIEYLMRSENIDAWEELFWTALSARRCWSAARADCDLPFAENVLAGILKREPAHHLRVFERSLRGVVREMRLLQDWSGRPWLGAIAESDLVERSRSFFRKCAKTRPELNFPQDFTADASFFAHSWTWQR